MFKNFLKFPTPKELGFSRNTLGLDLISPNDQETWEDYDRVIKQKYPIKYFFLETVGDYIDINIISKIKNITYWIKSMTIKRYHMLDLRQPNNDYNVDIYRYGWQDTPERMLYAIFNLLDSFVKNELNNFYCPSEEDCLKEPHLTAQREIYFEILAIHYWWTLGRKLECKNLNDIRSKWFACHHNEDGEKFYNELKKTEENIENKTQEMIMRLMKIRGSLWT